MTSRRRVRSLIVALSGVLLGSSALSASAQVFYEPVRFEYGAGAYRFYYGGHDPQVFRHVEADVDRTTYSSRAGTLAATPRPRIYSDLVPMQNVGSHEYTSYDTFTVDDARNEANANVPRYFRKRDLLRSRDNYVSNDDGVATLVVPAYAEPRIEVRVMRPFGAATTTPALQRGGILIIPKKVDPKQDKSVAMAK